jgi:predicted O-linked N-acetylglucosamine transferase (SPINDLY family)
MDLPELITSEIKYILSLIKKGQFILAKKKIDDLIKNNAPSAFLKNFEGFCYLELDDFTRAISCFQEAINLDKSFKYAYYNLGLTYQKKNIFNQAIKFFKDSLNIDPDYYDANLNLAFCLRQVKNFDEAIISYQKCISLRPEIPDAYNNISLVYLAQKKIDMALKALNQALKIAPSMFGIYNNIGLIYINLKNYSEAIINFKKVVDANPKSFDAYNNIALALFHLGKYDEAFRVSQKSLSINKDFIKGYWTLSLILKKLGKYKEAIKAAEKCLILNQNFYPIYSQLVTLYCEMAEHNKAQEIIDKILKLSKDEYQTFDSEDIQVSIFHYNYLNNFKIDNYKKLIDIYKNNFFEKNEIKLIKKDNQFKNKKIKIAFISADFKQHAVLFQLNDVFEELSKNSEIEIYAYSNNPKEDILTKKIINLFKSFERIYNISDKDLAQLMISNNIDVLIDLSGHTTGNRLTIFNYKPAKVCATWAGYLASTFVPNIDYIIADKYTIPAQEEINYSEKVIRLSTWSVLSDIKDDLSINEAPPCIKNNFVTFGSLNNISKINDDVIKLWSKILLNIKNSKILLKNYQFDSSELKEVIKKKFISFDVHEERIILEGSSMRNDLLKTYNKIDIALDPFPYGGGTTNLEAAWMCVPILTKKGNSFVSRCGESVNNNLGLNDWVAENEIDYFNKALSFSNQIKLAETKKYLRDNKKKTPIFDIKKITNELIENISYILKYKNIN